MKFTKAIISLSLASLALATPSNQLQSVDGTRRGYICCYDDVNISSNSRNCDVYPTDSNRGNGIDYRCGTSCLRPRIEYELDHIRHSPFRRSHPTSY